MGLRPCRIYTVRVCSAQGTEKEISKRLPENNVGCTYKEAVPEHTSQASEDTEHRGTGEKESTGHSGACDPLVGPGAVRAAPFTAKITFSRS